MGHPAGLKRDYVELEKRRLKSIAMFRRGEKQADIARKLGVHRQSVSRWYKAYMQGEENLRWNGKKGRPRILSAEQIKAIESALLRGAASHGYDSDLWTLRRVADIIEKEASFRPNTVFVWRTLKQIGWSSQRPAKKAIQRDETAILRWKKTTWPQIKKKPKTGAKP